MNGFKYVFNGKKTQNMTLIKEKFQDIFKYNNYQIWDDMINANSDVFRSFIGNKAEFIQKVNSADNELFKFIEILQ